MPRSLQSRCRTALNRLLRPAGLALARANRSFEMDDLLAGAAGRGLRIGTWIDIGASDGSWSLLARKHFPQSRYLLFEPLAERQPALQRLGRRHGFETVAAAAGPAEGSVCLQVDPGLDGSSVDAAGGPGGRQVPQTSVDRAVSARSLPGPYGLKLDTHGFEIPILEGAAQTLAHAELLIIEAYNFTVAPGALRFHELCAWLAERDFRCCDLADPMRRPADGLLWQMDLAFAPARSPFFGSSRYR